METCSSCQTERPDGQLRCPECGARATPTTLDLRIDRERVLDAAASALAQEPAPGSWGRADEVEALRDSVVQLPPDLTTEEVQATDEPSIELQASTPPEDIPRDPSTAVASTLPPPQRGSAPPVLASESLRKEMSPAEPGQTLVPVMVGLTGLIGASLSLWLLGLHREGITVAVGFTALLALAVAPIPYTGRATALAMLAGGGVIAATWVRSEHMPTPEALGLTGVVLLLGTALHLRAWHRGSLAARVLVALGMGAGIAWLGAEGSWADLSALEPDLRETLPRVLRVPFGLLLMVSLLAFMDARTTGGCDAWAVGLWVWYACFVGVKFATLSWTETGPDWAATAPQLALSLVATPLLLPTVGLALAQLLASTLSGLGVAPPSAPQTPTEDPEAAE